MDGIKNMAEKILQDGKERAASILEDAYTQIREIEKQTEKISESRIKQFEDNLKVDSEKLKLTIESNSELEKRNDLLKCKQEKIDQVFDMAIVSVQEMEPASYINMLVGKLLRSVVTGTEEVIFSPRDKEQIAEQIISAANQELGRLGQENQLQLSDETADIKGG
ncbi:MAG TPA: V-type ATP synthase subunit E, partial [Fusibacter sp.]|nr:V-type ATP synthase subunit E [Fusibacter sp.]